MRENDARTALDEALATIERLRADLARVRAAHGETIQTLLHRLDAMTEERDLALGMRDRVVTDHDALKAKLAWAQDELSKVWSALRGLR